MATIHSCCAPAIARLLIMGAAGLLCCGAPLADAPLGPDKSWSADDPASAVRSPEYTDMERKSFYVPMRDGVKLAVDVWLPVGLVAGTRLPAIMEQTRYYRSALLKSDPNGACRPPGKPTISLFVTHGYAYIMVDVRGSGASFGARTAEYSDDEVKDGAEVVEWILRQSWSNGQVGSQGQSYVGTTSEFLLRNHHPAVKAIAPSFSGYDFYTEILSPGGIRTTFGKYWSDLIQDLDTGAPVAPSPILAPCAVDEDQDKSMLRAAIAQHGHNFNVLRFLDKVEFRDDRFEGVNADGASPYHFQKTIDAAGAPLYAIVGWYDSGYTLGALRRYLNSTSPDRRVLIGPWNHGARYYYGPGTRQPTASSFNLAAEKLRYFDYELKGIDAGFSSSPPIRYFTTGSNRWQGTNRWPPAESRMQSWYFADAGGLGEKTPPTNGVDEHSDDGTANSGDNNRWRATMGPFPVFYPDRAAEDRKLLTYTSAPLASAMEVTGNPVAHVFLSTDAIDTDVIVFLEEVTPDGQVNYVTEGELKASHRRRGASPFRTPELVLQSHRRSDATKVKPGKAMQLDINLLPLSHVFAAGSRIRIALAASDRAQFQDHAVEPVRWKVFRTAAMRSQVELPVVARKTDAR